MTAGLTSSADAVIWGLILIVSIGVLAAAVWWVRRRFVIGETGEVAAGPLWTLQHLRDLKTSGAVSEEEFTRLKQMVLSSVAGAHDVAGADSADSSAEPATDENQIKRPANGGR